MEGSRGPSILCGPLKQEHEHEVQHGLQDGGAPTVHHSQPAAALWALAEQPRLVLGFCCSNYEQCEIWQAERRRVSEGHDSFEAMAAADRAAAEAEAAKKSLIIPGR